MDQVDAEPERAGLTDRLEPRPLQKTAALNRRVKRYRARQRQGVALLRIPVDLLVVQNCLIDDQRLGPADTLERPKVEAAVRAIVSEWCEWRMSTPTDADQKL
jgi:hypothetical protein